MVEDDNLPTRLTLLQLRLQPLALGKEIRQLAVGIQEEELYRTITEGEDMVVGNL